MTRPRQNDQYLDEVLKVTTSVSSTIPAQRAAFKKGFSFSGEPFAKQLSIWDYIWQTSIHSRARMHACFFLEQHVNKRELHDAIWHTSASWQESVTGWGLCDTLAKINTKVLETYPDRVYKQLTQWNKDESLWKRRQSVVSVLYYSRTKKVFLTYKKIESLVKPLLRDKEYYVQKGVGWTLREMHTVYPADTMAFLAKEIRNIHPIAFTIAIEKLTANQKDTLKAMRNKTTPGVT